LIEVLTENGPLFDSFTFCNDPPLHLLVIFLPILFFCAIASGNVSEEDRNKAISHAPELIQQEIAGIDFDKSKIYTQYNRLRKEGPVIPGIFQSAVPQGTAYHANADLILISNYMSDGRPSCVTVVSMKDGLLKKTLWLLNPDGSQHTGHVGGLAVSNEHLWIASGKGVYYVSLETLENQQNNNELTMTRFIPTAAKGSFATFSNGILWIGEFTSLDGKYPVPESHYLKTSDGNINHGWMAGFILDSQSDMINLNNKIDDLSYPDYILSIPHEVQGAAFIDNSILLSQSYGRKNDSRITIYLDPRNEPPHTTIAIDHDNPIPVWVLDQQNLVAKIIAPPMSEGIVNYKGSAMVLYESGSDKYRSTSRDQNDRIDILKIMMEH